MLCIKKRAALSVRPGLSRFVDVVSQHKQPLFQIEIAVIAVCESETREAHVETSVVYVRTLAPQIAKVNA